MKVNKIRILGGGSAGWMTAAVLIHDYPDKDIAVIESPNIPKIGVGESTYDGIYRFLRYLEIDKKDFMYHADATLKLGVMFNNFGKLDDGGFCFSFGSPQFPDQQVGFYEYFAKKHIYPETPTKEFSETYFSVTHLINNNTMTENEDDIFTGYRTDINTALHFDAIKFSNWLKQNYAMPRGVKNILAEVKEVRTNENGVSGLVLDNGEIETADLYIDCTGFKSLLLGGALQEKFLSCNHLLPNNTAWAAQVPYIDKPVELENVTRATALANGWVWNTPLWSRIGTGYVYSDKFVSAEDALEEFKEHLMGKHMVIPRTREQVDALEYRQVPFKAGRYERLWVKNVVAIGLAGAFLEPLESNGLFSVHEFAVSLTSALDTDYVREWDKTVFNNACSVLFDGWIDFIKVHYALSSRDDSAYWRSQTQEEINLKDYSGYLENKGVLKALALMKNRSIPIESGGGIGTGAVCIAAGLGYNLFDKPTVGYLEMVNKVKYEDFVGGAIQRMDAMKKYWDDAAKKCKSSYEYLKETYRDFE